MINLHTLLTYWQSESEALKEENCNGNSSWDAERRADAAITDGLNSENFMSLSPKKKKKKKDFIRVTKLKGIRHYIFIQLWISTILRAEDDLGSSVFQSLRQWMVVQFEERHKEGEKWERCYRSHFPAQSIKN